MKTLVKLWVEPRYRRFTILCVLVASSLAVWVRCGSTRLYADVRARRVDLELSSQPLTRMILAHTARIQGDDPIAIVAESQGNCPEFVISSNATDLVVRESPAASEHSARLPAVRLQALAVSERADVTLEVTRSFSARTSVSLYAQFSPFEVELVGPGELEVEADGAPLQDPDPPDVVTTERDPLASDGGMAQASTGDVALESTGGETGHCRGCIMIPENCRIVLGVQVQSRAQVAVSLSDEYRADIFERDLPVGVVQFIRFANVTDARSSLHNYGAVVAGELWFPEVGQAVSLRPGDDLSVDAARNTAIVHAIEIVEMDGAPFVRTAYSVTSRDTRVGPPGWARSVHPHLYDILDSGAPLRIFPAAVALIGLLEALLTFVIGKKKK